MLIPFNQFVPKETAAPQRAKYYPWGHIVLTEEDVEPDEKYWAIFALSEFEVLVFGLMGSGSSLPESKIV